MYLKEKIVKKIILALFVFLGVTFVGCSSPSEKIGTGGSVEVKDYSFSYDEKNLNIAGYAYIGVSGTISNNVAYEQEVKFANFVVETKCKKKSFEITPQEVIVKSNSFQKIEVDLKLSKTCYEPTFILRGEKISTTTLIDIEGKKQEPVMKVEKWSKTLNLQGIDKGNSTNYSNIKVNKNEMNLDSQESIILSFLDREDESKIIEAKDIQSVKLTIQNPTMLQFDNYSNPTTIVYYGDNNKIINLKSNNIAGDALIKVEATILDGKEVINIENMFSIKILSGEINTMSIILQKSESKMVGAFYENTYQIHLVDKNGNKANAGKKIYVGVVNGVKYNGIDGIINTLNQDTVFNTNTVFDINNINTDSDKLVIMANENRINPDYLGAWSIFNLFNNNSFSLKEPYNGVQTNNLNFIIGDERRYNMCSDSTAVAHVDMDNNIYEIDSNGKATMKLIYDPYLLGKTVYIYANTINKNGDETTKRVGVAIKEVLFGTGLKGDDSKGQNLEGFQDRKDGNITILATENRKISIPIYLKTDNHYAKDITIGAMASGDCNISESTSKIGCNGQADFEVTIIPRGKCNVNFTGIVYENNIK